MKKYLFTLLFPIFLSSCAVHKVHKANQPLLTEAKQSFYGGDYQRAAKDLDALAKAGDPEAQYALGYMYYYGMGVKKDDMVARRLIRLSAEKGNIEAIKALRILVDSNRIFANVENIPPKNVDYSKTANLESDTIKNKEVLAKNDSDNSKNENLEDNDFKDITTKNQEDAFKLVKFDNAKKLDSSPKIATKLAKDYSEHNLIKNKELTPKVSIPKTTAETANTLATASSNSKSASPVAGLNSWLAKASEDAYTIQLAANKNKKVIDDFIKKYNLASKAKIYTYNYNNEQWYAVSLGVYNEPAAAFNVLTKLPTNLKANKPWVRQISNIKKEVFALSKVPNALTNIG